MKFGFFGDDILISAPDAAAHIQKYQEELAKRERAKDFRVWHQMYAQPFARDLLYKSHLDVIRTERRAEALANNPDSGVKAVGEVAKVSDKLVETKQKQAEVQQQMQKAASAGNQAEAMKLAEADRMLAKKAFIIEGQLSRRVGEGVDLAKAKQAAESKRQEVIAMREAQRASAPPQLVEMWKKQDEEYEKQRADLLAKFDKAEKEASQRKAELQQMPPGLEKDAKMERLRKLEADRRVGEQLELAKFDERELARLEGRAKAEGMKKVS